MTYTPRSWVPHETVIGAVDMSRIEQAVVGLTTEQIVLAEDLDAVKTQVGQIPDGVVTAEDLEAVAGRTTSLEQVTTALTDSVAEQESRLADVKDRVQTAEDTVEASTTALAAVKTQAEDTAEIVERIKRTNVSAGEGAPTGTAPVGWIHIDVATGDTYRMEA